MKKYLGGNICLGLLLVFLYEVREQIEKEIDRCYILDNENGIID